MVGLFPLRLSGLSLGRTLVDGGRQPPLTTDSMKPAAFSVESAAGTVIPYANRYSRQLPETDPASIDACGLTRQVPSAWMW